jgi:hypothetical protein
MPAAGYVVRRLDVKVKTTAGSLTEYNTAVLSVKENPTRTNIQTPVASGDVLTDVGPTTWTIDVEAMAEYASGSFLRLLLDNDGKTGNVEWYPNPVAAPTLKRTAAVVLVAPAIDNTVGAPASFTVSLLVVGAITTV